MIEHWLFSHAAPTPGRIAARGLPLTRQDRQSPSEASTELPENRWRIGVIAPEFPPVLGGMAELARGITLALAAVETVYLYSYAPPDLAPDEDLLAGRVVLPGRPWLDAPILARAEEEIDLWLGLNAGLAPLARRLRKPFFCFFAGNDFLNPWLPCGPTWLERIRTPHAASIRVRLRRRAIRRAAPQLRRSLAISRQTADLMVGRLGIPSEDASVVHPGVPEAFFQCAETAATDEIHVLTVSRLTRHSRRKNIDSVLRAMMLLPADLPARLTIVGDGDDRARLEDLTRRLGLATRVAFLGAVSLEELLRAYRDASVFVLASKASRKDVEGFGIVYAEASASGLPVICSRAGGATDAVVSGENGIVIDESSPEAIARAIEFFAANRDRFPPEKVRSVAARFRYPTIVGDLRALIARYL